MNLYSLPPKAFRLQLKLAMKMRKISVPIDETNKMFVRPRDRERFDQLERRRNKVIKIGEKQIETRRNKKESG